MSNNSLELVNSQHNEQIFINNELEILPEQQNENRNHTQVSYGMTRKNIEQAIGTGTESRQKVSHIETGNNTLHSDHRLTGKYFKSNNTNSP